MTRMACPACLQAIDSSHLAYQCVGRGNVACRQVTDEARVRMAGNAGPSYPVFMQQGGRSDATVCPYCGGLTRRRACPACHTALPADYISSRATLIGLVGSKWSGKTVLMTALVRHLREVVGRQQDADIRIAMDNPDGFDGLSAYYKMREDLLYGDRMLPAGTMQYAQKGYATPIVLRWRQQVSGSPQTTMLSICDSSGEDTDSVENLAGLRYLSECGALIIVIDPLSVQGARDMIHMTNAAVGPMDDEGIYALANITDALRMHHGIRRSAPGVPSRKLPIPVAIVFTKMDSFWGLLGEGSPIKSNSPALAGYNEMDGLAVHENMRALLLEWGADMIDTKLRVNYSDYRYFAVSALGAAPDYNTSMVDPGGVRPHRVQDPVLWLLSKMGAIPVVKTA